MEDEIKWIEEIKKRNKKSFENIIKKWQKRILNYFYKNIFNRDDAEELTQELFIKLYNHICDYDKHWKFSTWIYRIAYNMIIDFKRKNKNVSLSFDGESKEEETIKQQLKDKNSQADIENLLETTEIQEKVKKTLLLLPENQRNAIILKIYEEKSYEEIAEIMEISKAAVESLLFRARENLKKILIL